MDVVPQFVSFLFDRLSLFFLSVILLVSIPSAVHAVGYLRGEYPRRKIIAAGALLAAFVAAMLAVVTAANALFFLVAWEIMSLVSYFLVVFDDEDPQSVKAGMIYIVMTHIGTAFITAAFLILYHHAASFDLAAFRVAAQALPSGTKNLLFFLFLLGFGTKAGMVPLHLWLPYAHPQAPSPVSAIMSGVMVKTAVYGILRFIFVVLGIDAWWWGNTVMAFGALSCLVGIIYALMEQDLKRLLAYSTVENVGVILLGLGAAMIFLKSGMPVIGVLALTAALYHALNHAVFKSLLFLAAGNVYRATGLRNSEKLGGLIKRMPLTAALFLVGALAISALPPLNGFVSEWLTLQALFKGALSGPSSMKILMCLYATALALTGGLAAACFVKAFGISFLAMPRSAAAREAREVTPWMTVPSAFLALCSAALGLAAVPVLGVVASVAASVAGGVPTPALAINDLSFAPQPANGTFLSPLLITVLLAAAATVAFVCLRVFFGKPRVERGRTWGCGYYALDARTEYTATAFSKPLRIAFSFFLKPYRRTEQIKETRYHVTAMRYEVHTTPVIKHYVYRPTLDAVLDTARRMRRLQTGSVHLYLAYIFVTLVVLILFL